MYCILFTHRTNRSIDSYRLLFGFSFTNFGFCVPGGGCTHTGRLVIGFLFHTHTHTRRLEGSSIWKKLCRPLRGSPFPRSLSLCPSCLCVINTFGQALSPNWGCVLFEEVEAIFWCTCFHFIPHRNLRTLE